MIFFRPFEYQIDETNRISIKFDMSGPSNILPGEFNFFLPNATTCSFVDFVVLPPGHGRIVTDF